MEECLSGVGQPVAPRSGMGLPNTGQLAAGGRQT
jgi:hypothetical protein